MTFEQRIILVASSLGNFGEEQIDEGSGLLVLIVKKVVRIWVVLGQDHFVYLEGIVLVLSKGNVSALKFEHANSKGPDVNIESIASSLYYLRSHVVGSADDWESFLIFGENFGGSQIYHS